MSSEVEIINARKMIFDQHFAALEHPLNKGLLQLLISSDYALRHLDVLKKLLAEDEGTHSLCLVDYWQMLTQISTHSRSQFLKDLRQLRHRVLIRLLLREYANEADIIETMASWSDFAEAAILMTISYCAQELNLSYGMPLQLDGLPAKLDILAMGKLGGRELNYSSDIDLIFAFSQLGQTSGPQSIDNVQYYTRLIQQFIQILQQITPEGFVFRVDLRLRPNGESSAVTCSLATMETYYQEQGRDWERYAMVKARLLGESPLSLHWINRLIVPFVYRKYIDFGVIESLRSMKSLIEREVQINPMLDDIKRGSGGIREIEFIIQSIQLIRGGRLPQLRVSNLLAAIDQLEKEKLLKRTSMLKRAYLFYRRLENALQAHNDQQTHSLPIQEEQKIQIAYAINCKDWQELLIYLHKFQRFVSSFFNSILFLKQANAYHVQEDERLLERQLLNVWQGQIEPGMAANLLASLNYAHPRRCYELINDFRCSARCKRLSQAGRMVLDRFMPVLLKELILMAADEHLLIQVIHLLEKVVGRSTYLALLMENPSTLRELLNWFKKSHFIADLIVHYPFLLEVLLDFEGQWQPPTKQKLRQELKSKLAQCQDMEDKEEQLRQYKLIYWLLVARAELSAAVDAIQAGVFLADVAEVILLQVIQLATEQLSLKHPEILRVVGQFIVIAYGKLGSREMSYDSDLDLVFLYRSEGDASPIATRLTQKIMHMLTSCSQMGQLYQVDTRLRPSGSAGLLVNSFDSFINYQKNEAWVWEHQALIRSRVILGTQTCYREFIDLKKTIFMRDSDPVFVLQEIKSMREKIEKYQKNESIKYLPGGLIDWEFLLQALVIIFSKGRYVRETQSLRLLERLAQDKVISSRHHQILCTAYKKYHEGLHQQLLSGTPVSITIQAQQVLKIIESYYAG